MPTHTISESTWDYILKDCKDSIPATYELVKVFRDLTPEMAKVYIDQFKIHWPEEIIDDMIKLCGDVLVSPIIARNREYLTRRYFYVAAWLAGASWRQLGHMFQIKYQSVIQAANKLMAPTIRQAVSSGRSRVTYTQVEAMWKRYEMMLQVESIDKISRVPIVMVAGILYKDTITAADPIEGQSQDEHWDNTGASPDEEYSDEPSTIPNAGTFMQDIHSRSTESN